MKVAKDTGNAVGVDVIEGDIPAPAVLRIAVRAIEYSS